MAGSESEPLTWGVNTVLTNYPRNFPDTQIATGRLPRFVPMAVHVLRQQQPVRRAATVRGQVSSEWRRRSDGRIDLAVTVPYNMDAEIWVPTQDRPVTAPRGVTFVRDDTSGGAGYKVYRAGVGSYRFNAR
ncbi:alpha-L-rhamnosidase C-terminal domain-containing protein [Streptomyces sp. NBC_01451]|uniref:alpha-L-rhamnosidase C-terminal domain-containing protein n=1 Tax=Streptomyces sp. NBC_01451 TaxID=2903872 RepID=UPI002E339492|nr:alpha-L-rhamnosidase C-terminal domain-containing protein [Streptomyces sp. NBC_01451]